MVGGAGDGPHSKSNPDLNNSDSIKGILHKPLSNPFSLDDDVDRFSNRIFYNKQRKYKLNKFLPSKTGLELWEARRQEKLERASRGYDIPVRIEGSWRYNRPEWKKALSCGYKLPIEQAEQDYLEWVKKEEYNVIQDSESEDFVFVPIVKRGNKAYAKKYQRRRDELKKQFKGLRFAERDSHSRSNYCNSLLVFITLTYDHKRVDEQYSWQHSTQDINNFKKKARRRFGHDLNFLRCLEGTSSGYAAPHMLVLLEKPVRCVWHPGRLIHGRTTKGRWIVQSKVLIDSIRGCWPYGFIDVRAVGPDNQMDGKDCIDYALKYLTKSVDSFGKNNKLVARQMTWQKVFNKRPLHISKSFKDHLNPFRLDISINKSFHDDLTKPKKWIFIGRDSYENPCSLKTMFPNTGPPGHLDDNSALAYVIKG